jgi:putative NADH-flavin reductase
VISFSSNSGGGNVQKAALRVFVLGATGKTGRTLVAQGLARGHQITTFGRSAFGGTAKSLRNVVGNPMRANELAAELPDHDVVLSVLGTRGLGSTSVLADSARATIEAMGCVGPGRLVILSSVLLDSNIGWGPRLIGSTILRHHVRDQRAMETQVTASSLDWTVIRATRFSHSGFSGRYVVSAESGRAGHAPISCEDVACLMLDTAERGDCVKQVVRICGATP